MKRWCRVLSYLYVSTYPPYSLPLLSRMMGFSFNISFEGPPPPNLGTWALWSPKSGLNIPSEPQRRLALFCGLGGWAFIFWSNLINFGSSGSKVVWLIAKYDSNYRGTREISDLPEISSVCTSQSSGSWRWALLSTVENITFSLRFSKKDLGLCGRWLEKKASSFRRLVPRGVWGSTRGQFGIWQRACPRLLDPIRQPRLWFVKQTWKIYS